MEWATLSLVSLLSLGVNKEELVKLLLRGHDGLKQGW